MAWIAGAVIGGASLLGSIGSGIIGSNASSSASKAQIAAQQQTLNWIQSVYQGTGAGLNPYIGTGQQALGSLASFYGIGGNPQGAAQGYQAFQQTPFYQFPLQQANLATNRALAASGLTNSGGALRDVSQLNAGYASQGLGQYLSGLGSLASSGQSAAAQLGSIGVGTSAQIGQANTNIGNASALGTIGSANAINSAIGGGLGALTNPATINAGIYGVGLSSYGGPASVYGPMNGNAPGSIPGGGNGYAPAIGQ